MSRLPFLKSMFLLSKQACFLRERYEILFFCLFCIKNKVEEIWIFWRKRWTYPWRKIIILLFFFYKNLFFLSLKASFLSRTSTNTFSRFFLDKNETERYETPFFLFILHKNKVEKIWNFWRKRWTYPFGKTLILRFSWRSVIFVLEGFFLSRASTNTFPRSILDKNEREKKN